MTTAWKFLDDRSTAVISGFRWPTPTVAGEPGPWVVAGDVVPCEQGVHACTLDQLAWWMSAQLWEIELDGEVQVDTHKIAAERGRLVQRADGWPEVGAELAEWAVWRVRDHVVAALTAVGEGGVAGPLAAATDFAMVAQASATPVFAADTPAAVAIAQVRDSLDDIANPIFACWDAARAAGHAASAIDRSIASYQAAFAAERVVQSRWLAGRLGLAEQAAR
jgi:hypothetical protein